MAEVRNEMAFGNKNDPTCNKKTRPMNEHLRCHSGLRADELSDFREFIAKKRNIVKV